VKAKPALRRALFPAAMVCVAALLWVVDGGRGAHAARTALSSLGEMAMILPPIFIILGLLDVWVPRETMVRFMGDGSGLRGAAIAFALGSAAAGPLYGAFPIAQVLLRKGASFRNVMVFIGAWSTTKVPLVMFEAANLGLRFAMTRLAVDIVGIAAIALAMERLLRPEDRAEILAKAG
jgi:uncharacterized membrane protein YraQ (UPF0718 family)